MKVVVLHRSLLPEKLVIFTVAILGRADPDLRMRAHKRRQPFDGIVFYHRVRVEQEKIAAAGQSGALVGGGGIADVALVFHQHRRWKIRTNHG